MKQPKQKELFFTYNNLLPANLKLPNQTKNKKKLTFIDLFAGIGGFHIALHNLGAECVFASEWDESARKTYQHNLYGISSEIFDNDLFAGDITLVDPKDIPDFDILCAGFPCQPFSQAGFKKGFNETRGTLFFNIASILKEKSPSAFFLENVRHLFAHDEGKTFQVIERTIRELGYSFFYKIVKASDYGLPQHRPRLFMVGFKNNKIKFEFPNPVSLKYNLSEVLGGKCEKEIGFTLRVGGRSSGINDRRNWDTYLVDGKIKKIGYKEGLKLQGFPDDFKFPVTDAQAMKQLGNSVAIPAIQAVAEEIIKQLK
jgi:DNA (cytosine-5)-methyltransferase 1